MDNYGTIGGTTISAIVGASPWLSPRGAYLKLRGESGPKPDSEAMARGRKFETVVARVFQANHPEYFVARDSDRASEECDDAIERVQDAELSYLTGSPDRVLFGADGTEDEYKILAGLEIKTAQSTSCAKWGERGTDQIPLVYLVQCNWYMGFYDVSKWEVAVMFFNAEHGPVGYNEYTIYRDEGIIEALRKAAVEFWEKHVVPGIPPEDDTVDETVVEFVKNQYPADTAPVEVANEEEEKKIERYARAKDALNKAESEFKAAKLAVREALRERAGFFSRLGTITCKKSKDRFVIDWKAIAMELGASQEQIDRHAKTVEGSRIFNDRNLRIEEVC
jgi:predicted phage-related endonuclease